MSEQTALQDQLLATKLQFPSSMHRLVARPRLLERLRQELEGKLTLICAPAGSGKTTLFIEWLQSAHGDDLPVAWVSLDEGDNDPARFWRYVCAALERIDASVGEHMRALLHTSSLPIEAILVQLINLLVERARPFVLLLDDYHLITTAQIHQALNYLLDHMPPHMHLVIMTRVEPPIPLARLRGRRQVVEVRDADLRFTLEEADSLLREVMELPLVPKQIQALAWRTEGWVVGLQLAALAMRDRTDLAEFISTFTGSNRYIVDYLVEEVISRQPADVQTFLLSTAILSRICASLCASVLGDDQKGQEEALREESTSNAPDSTRHCQQMLEYLERANLFLIPLDQERRWYRYHHLVAEVLVGRLHYLHPSLVAELHQRASAWYEQHDFLHEAIEHAPAAVEGAFASLALVERLAHAASAQRPLAMIAALRAQFLLRQGDIASAARWAEMRGLSANDVSSLLYQPDPREFEYTALARLFIAQGRYDEARKLLEGLLRAAQAAGRGGSVIEILILQALAEDARGASRHALAILGHALTLAEPEGYIRVFADEREPMRTLLSQVHPTNQRLHAYVQTLLAACHASTFEHVAEVPPSTKVARPQQPLLDPLSDRELEVLHLLADGATNAEIAEHLFITSSTVKRHLSNIYSKLAVANRTQAVAHARALGIL